MLNTRSQYLTILVATYNRLPFLQKTLDSISSGTRCDHEIIVVDGGSTDGTIQYLQSHPGITPVFQGELLGTARCYNRVWREIESTYTCWLSDDTEVIAGSLDAVVRILEQYPEIGMVGLKMKDVNGPYSNVPYMGGLSCYGILNCNHGVLSTVLLRSVGYFNENYRSYFIDPDLTASVLCTGKRVVMTKQTSIHHYRPYAESVEDQIRQMKREMGEIDNNKIYQEKFRFLKTSPTPGFRRKKKIGRYLGKLLFWQSQFDSVRLGLNQRDQHNLIKGRFIRLTDPLEHIHHPYHLVQKIPMKLLMLNANPYRHLVGES
jgi:glycosyltransferase involved in cell wall biosynthesis